MSQEKHHFVDDSKKQMKRKKPIVDVSSETENDYTAESESEDIDAVGASARTKRLQRQLKAAREDENKLLENDERKKQKKRKKSVPNSEEVSQEHVKFGGKLIPTFCRLWGERRRCKGNC